MESRDEGHLEAVTLLDPSESRIEYLCARPSWEVVGSRKKKSLLKSSHSWVTTPVELAT